MLESILYGILILLGVAALVLVLVWILMVALMIYVTKRYQEEVAKIYDSSLD